MRTSGFRFAAEANFFLAREALERAFANGVARAAAVRADKVEGQVLVGVVAAGVVDGEEGDEALLGAGGDKGRNVVAEVRRDR